MHDYSINKNPKYVVLFGLAILSTLIGANLQGFAKIVIDFFSLGSYWTMPVIAVPTFTIYGGLYYLFNNRLWRVKNIRKYLLVPDLNGTWNCDGKTCLKNGEQTNSKWKGEITIKQSWSKILIYLKTNKSESKSISASIYHEDGVGYRLFYQFDNSPNANQHDLQKHSGSCELLFKESLTSATGSYYTNQHRTTVGTMKLINAEAKSVKTK